MALKKKPPARDADGFRNVLCSPANVSEGNRPALVLQFLIRRFGFMPEIAPMIGEPAGLEVRP